MTARVTREGAGFYAVSNGTRVVSVIRNSDLIGSDKWIAAARWDRHHYTDPVATKREAVRHARRMLDEA